MNTFYHHISQLWNSQNSNRAKLSLSSGAAFKCRGSALCYFPFWPWPCGVTTTEASITRARWETAAGSSITAERRGRLNWQLSPPPLWRLGRLVWNYNAKSASLPGSSVTPGSVQCMYAGGVFFLTLLLTSKQSYRLVPLKLLCELCYICVHQLVEKTAGSSCDHSVCTQALNHEVPLNTFKHLEVRSLSKKLRNRNFQPLNCN